MSEDMSWEKALGTPLPDKEKKRQHEGKTNLHSKRQLITAATLLASLCCPMLVVILRSSTDHRALCDGSLIEVCSVCMQITAIAIMAAWQGLKSWPQQQGLAGQAYPESALERLETGSKLLELPEGQSCDVHDREGEDVTCVPHATWQRLMAAKVRLRHLCDVWCNVSNFPPK